MKRKKPPRVSDPKVMAIGSLNGKKNEDGKGQTIIVARQSNKLARRMVRTHVMKDKSPVGKGLASMRGQQARSLHPHEKRALRRAEMERRAQAQLIVEDGVSGQTTAERSVLVLDSDQDELLALANEPQRAEDGDQSTDGDGGRRDE